MSVLKIERTDASNPRFQELVRLLDLDLVERYGPPPDTIKMKNQVDSSVKAVVGWWEESPVSCGCFRKYDEETVELKRMFVKADVRGKGFGGQIVNALEVWAREEGYRTVVLETATGQPEAMGLYQKLGFERMENYPPYQDIENSRCMRKSLNRSS